MLSTATKPTTLVADNYRFLLFRGERSLQAELLRSSSYQHLEEMAFKFCSLIFQALQWKHCFGERVRAYRSSGRACFVHQGSGNSDQSGSESFWPTCTAAQAVFRSSFWPTWPQLGPGAAARQSLGNVFGPPGLLTFREQFLAHLRFNWGPTRPAGSLRDQFLAHPDT